MNDFLSALLGNAPRARLLRVFFAQEGVELSAAEAAKRIAVGPRITEREIGALQKLGIVRKARAGKKGEGADTWTADLQFRYARALGTFVRETSPAQFADVERALKGAGRMTVVVLSGCFLGDPTRPADLLVAGDGLNERKIESAVKNLELLLGHEIRYATFSTPEFRYRLTVQDRLVRDTLDFPHRVLVDRLRLFAIPLTE